jgi:hypothetical protein
LGWVITISAGSSWVDSTREVSAELELADSWGTLEWIDAFLTVTESSSAPSFHAVLFITFVVAWTRVTQTTIFFFANLVHSAILVGILTLWVTVALSADVKIVKTLVWFAHVVVVVAFSSIIQLLMACVIIESTILSCLVAMQVSDLFASVHSIRLVSEALVACICFMDELRALFAQALPTIIADLLVIQLWHAIVVVVHFWIAHVFAELCVLVTADGENVDDVALSILDFLKVALVFLQALCLRASVQTVVFCALLAVCDWDEATVFAAVRKSYFFPPEEIHFFLLVFVAIIKVGAIWNGNHAQ